MVAAVPCTRPIATQLESALGGKWKAVRDGFGWKYQSDTGRTVRRYSQSVIGFDGYRDDVFCTVFIDDTGKHVGSGGVIWSPPKEA